MPGVRSAHLRLFVDPNKNRAAHLQTGRIRGGISDIARTAAVAATR